MARKDQNQQEQQSKRAKRITRDDLRVAAEAAMNAAGVVADALESGQVVDLPGPVDEASTRAAEEIRSQMSASPSNPTRVKPDPETGTAYEEFMAALEPTLQKLEGKVSVDENAGWMKIEGIKSGERVYVAKGKRSVNRITCTLPPEMVEGATEPTAYNGLIKSWLPATTEAVTKAIELIASVDPQKREPRQRRPRQEK